MFRKLLFLITLFINCTFITATSLPDISADGALLIDTKTNTVLYAKNMNLPFYPASTTKILTALAIVQDLEPQTVVSKTQAAINNVPSDSSQIGLNVGDQYTVYDGLHAVLMASDNFVCYDLAVKDSGSIPAFAQKMNHLALLSHANIYNFVNPHGYHDPNHYISPYSLAKIAIEAFNNPVVEEIAGTYQYNFSVLNTNRAIPLTHTAALLNPNSSYYNPHVKAVKTGFHDMAKRTLVAKASYDDMELIGVIMRTDAPKHFEDMNKLFSYAAENFSITNDSTGNPILINHTYSPWAERYIQEALSKGWITHTSHNYLTPVSERQFINLLKSISINRFDAQPTFNTVNGNALITKTKVASILYDYLSPLNLTTLPQDITLSSTSHLSPKEQQAIRFCIQAKLLNIKDESFNPNETITYEEALCLISKVNGILERYTAYHL